MHLQILPQPDNTTCGPTCLQAVYRFYGDSISLDEVVAEAPRLEGGGTLAVFMACHALRRGYSATIYTYNLQVFDPSWFNGKVDVEERLRMQKESKQSPKLRTATRAYLEFLERGGQIRFEDLNVGLLRRYLDHSIPILTGLSATYLYRCSREFGPDGEYDDVRGLPVGHFVVLYGYNRETGNIRVADPLASNPAANSQVYEMEADRVIGAILLGILTYDANLLIIHPRGSGSDQQRWRL